MWISCASVLDENGEESEEPPVPVVKEIKEKDAFYSKKYTSRTRHSLNTTPVSLVYMLCFKMIWSETQV